MLAKLGCSYVLVRHSSAASTNDEDDAPLGQRQGQGCARGLGHADPVRVGEPLAVRRAGTHVEHVLAQLTGSLAMLPAEQAASLVIAYEPVRAIGTGEVVFTPDDARQMAAAIRQRILATAGAEAASGVRILYGGSVKGDNIAPIMAGQDVDGALVGGASLDAGQFAAICRYRELATGR